MKMKIILSLFYVTLIRLKMTLSIEYTVLTGIAIIVIYTLFMVYKRVRQGYSWYNDLPNTLRLLIAFSAALMFEFTILSIIQSLLLFTFSIMLNDELQRKIFRIIFPKKVGAIIAFLGIDGSGKTTHALNLVKELNELGFKAVYISYTKYIFMDKLSSLFARKTKKGSSYIFKIKPPRNKVKAALRVLLSGLDNLLLYCFVILPKANLGYIVICDRFSWSTWIKYMALKYPAKFFMKLFFIPKPHYFVVFDIPAELSWKKILERKYHIRYAISQLQYERRAYLTIARIRRAPIINTTESYEKCHSVLLNYVMNFLSKVLKQMSWPVKI